MNLFKKEILLLITLIFIFTTSIVASSLNLNEELQKLRAKGIPITIQELNLPVISDNENGAAVYRKIFKLVDTLQQKYSKEMEYFPYSGIKWNKASEKNKKKVINLILHNPDFAQLYQLLGKASYMQCQFFNVRIFQKAPQKEISNEMNILADLRGCARYLAEKVKIEAEYGNINKALDFSLIGLKLPQSLSNEPFLMAQLVRFAMDSIALSTLEEVVNKGGRSIKSIKIDKLLISQIDKERKSDSISENLKGDLVFFILPYFEHYKKLGNKVFEISKAEKEQIKNFSNNNTNLYNLQIQLLQRQKNILKQAYIKSRCKTPQEFFEKQEMSFLKIYGRIIPLMEKPYFAVRNDLTKVDSETLRLPQWNFTRDWSRAVSRAYFSEANIDAELGAAELGIANIMYRLKYGKFVDSLNQLTPKILPDLPLDPFTGKNYIYRKEGKGFIIYSVGQNMIDDGGKEKDFTGIPDIVWKYAGN